jgi:LmbE family N-acetylglucosaminyl deacetylase
VQIGGDSIYGQHFSRPIDEVPIYNRALSGSEIQSDMSFTSSFKQLLQRNGIHPRRWLTGFVSYPRFLGYIKPRLMTASEEEFLVRRKLLTRAWEPRQLAAPVGKRIVALCPHPDDESIGAGGLLLAHRGRSEIHLVCLCKGDRGGELDSTEAGKSKLVEARKAEFRKTAETLKATSVRHLDYSDGAIPCSSEAIEQLRAVINEIRPDIVVLPWFLDGHVDHRRANVLYAWACSDIEATVLGYEIWTMLEPNALFDIAPYLPEKLALIQNYQSQLRTVDYSNYAEGLARVRAYHAPFSPRRSGAVEAFLALPNQEYCEMVCQLYGAPGRIRADATGLLDLTQTEMLAATK